MRHGLPSRGGNGRLEPPKLRRVNRDLLEQYLADDSRRGPAPDRAFDGAALLVTLPKGVAGKMKPVLERRDPRFGLAPALEAAIIRASSPGPDSDLDITLVTY